MVDNIIADRYVLQNELGAGGMGTVYRALDTRTNATVAIKQLKHDLTTPELIERFRREGEALRDLNHPNIVKMLDAVETEGEHFLVMEYLPAGDLKVLLERGQLPTERALQIAIDICDALTRAHRLDIIHRDLKPANVLIADDGTPRLTDFGIAQIGAKAHITETNAIMGTVNYLPPEALNGETIDARADIWAFGVMLFEMLTGKHPFEASSLSATITAILTTPLPDLEMLYPDLPIDLVDLIYRMLERDPHTRIASVRHVGASLEDIAKGRTSPSARGRFETPVSDFQIRTKHNLPAQTTPFVGREHELIELDRLFHDSDSRLITLLAPGGMGKTRLALAVAENALPFFADGVYLVELAPLSDPDNLVSAIASATEYPFQSDGRSPKQQLLDFLSEKALLLLMDNFEHLLEGADLVSDILRAAPAVKILATSRERLNLQGETLFRIEGMDFPEWETPEDALEYSAFKLFLQSARRATPDFELQADNLTYVARICRLVEGLPLGIVLAAAWVDALSPREIADEISRNVDFLETGARNVPERHRSIRAVFDYSWKLLTDSERAVLMKLSVFRGGFTREAAEAVAGANLRTLISLMNKSLIRRAADTGRYDIHELTRQYATSRLQDAGEESATQRVHATYFADFMAERYLDIKGRRQVDALDDIETDYENVRMAWGWGCQHVERGMIDRMVDGLYWYQDMRGQYREGIAHMQAAEQALAHDHDAALFHRVRMRRMRLMLIMHADEFSFDEAELFESLEAARSRNDRAETAFCLFVVSTMYYSMGQQAEAVPYTEQAYPLYQELGDTFFVSESLAFVASIKGLLGDDAAVPLMQQGLEIKGRIGDVSGMAWALLNYTYMMLGVGDYAEAEKSVRRGLEYMRRLKTVYGIIAMSNALAGVLMYQGKFTESSTIAAGALALAVEKRFLTGIMFATETLSVDHAILEEPELARQYLDQLKTTPANILSGLLPGQLETYTTLVALSAGDYATAKTEFALCANRFIPDIVSTFPSVAAALLAMKAVIDAYDERQESAAEWLAVAFHYHPLGTAWLDKWALITRLRADLKAQLGETAFNTAWERGKSRDMETVVQELSNEYRGGQ